MKRREEEEKAKGEIQSAAKDTANPNESNTITTVPPAYAKAATAPSPPKVSQQTLFKVDRSEAPPLFFPISRKIDTHSPQYPIFPHILDTTAEEAKHFRITHSSFHVQHYDILTIKDIETSMRAVKTVLESVYKGKLRISLPAPLDSAAPLTSPFFVHTESKEALHLFLERNEGIHSADGHAITCRKEDTAKTGSIRTVEDMLGYEGRNAALNNVLRNLAYEKKEMGEWIKNTAPTLTNATLTLWQSSTSVDPLSPNQLPSSAQTV